MTATRPVIMSQTDATGTINCFPVRRHTLKEIYARIRAVLFFQMSYALEQKKNPAVFFSQLLVLAEG